MEFKIITETNHNLLKEICELSLKNVGINLTIITIESILKTGGTLIADMNKSKLNAFILYYSYGKKLSLDNTCSYSKSDESSSRRSNRSLPNFKKRQPISLKEDDLS